MTAEDRARMLDAIEANLADVEVALARLDAGTYTQCESCGGELPWDLLEAAPLARRCGACTGP